MLHHLYLVIKMLINSPTQPNKPAHVTYLDWLEWAGLTSASLHPELPQIWLHHSDTEDVYLKDNILTMCKLRRTRSMFFCSGCRSFELRDSSSYRVEK